MSLSASEGLSENPGKSVNMLTSFEGRRGQYLDAIYLSRLRSSLEALANVFFKYSDRNSRVCKYSHLKTDGNVRRDDNSSAFIDVYNFPYSQEGVGASDILLSKLFAQFPTLSKMYKVKRLDPPYPAELPGGDLRRQVVELGDIDLPTMQELVSKVGEEMTAMAKAVEEVVEKEIEELNKRPDFDLLLSMISKNIAIDLSSIFGKNNFFFIKQLSKLIKNTILSNPKMEVSIVELISKFKLRTPDTPLTFQEIFSNQDVSEIVRMLIGNSGDNNKSQIERKSNRPFDPNAQLTSLESFLKNYNPGDLTIVSNLPDRDQSEILILPTDWFHRGTWMQIWSRKADIFREVGETLTFIASKEALELLGRESKNRLGFESIESILSLKRMMAEFISAYDSVLLCASNKNLSPVLNPSQSNQENIIGSIEGYESLIQKIIYFLLDKSDKNLDNQINNIKLLAESLIYKIENALQQMRNAVSEEIVNSDSSNRLLRMASNAFNSKIQPMNDAIERARKSISKLEEDILNNPSSIITSVGSDGELVRIVGLNIDGGSQLPSSGGLVNSGLTGMSLEALIDVND